MTDPHDASRRRLMIAASAAGAGLLLTTGNTGLVLAAQKARGKGEEKEVGAVEDLMREHGVLPRAPRLHRIRTEDPRQPRNYPGRCAYAHGQALPQLWRGVSRAQARGSLHLPCDQKGGRPRGRIR
jgi:hypothetical protein